MSDSLSERALVLIIEGDDVVASSLQNSLTRAGYTTQRAASAEEALVALQSTPADLILMNLLLPDCDGLILCSTLSAHSAAPIILLSNRANEVDRALARESGAVDWLTESVSTDELLARVESIVRPHAAPPVRRS
jgi:DNA-binding response OmpR family regulator